MIVLFKKKKYDHLSPRCSFSSTFTFSAALALMSGPWVVSGSEPWPTRSSASIAWPSFSMKRSWIPLCTRKRLEHTHVYRKRKRTEDVTLQRWHHADTQQRHLVPVPSSWTWSPWLRPPPCPRQRCQTRWRGRGLPAPWTPSSLCRQPFSAAPETMILHVFSWMDGTTTTDPNYFNNVWNSRVQNSCWWGNEEVNSFTAPVIKSISWLSNMVTNMNSNDCRQQSEVGPCRWRWSRWRRSWPPAGRCREPPRQKESSLGNKEPRWTPLQGSRPALPAAAPDRITSFRAETED